MAEPRIDFPAPSSYTFWAREWADTAVTLPSTGPWRDALTGTRLDGPELAVADAFATLPVALLLPV